MRAPSASSSSPIRRYTRRRRFVRAELRRLEDRLAQGGEDHRELRRAPPREALERARVELAQVVIVAASSRTPNGSSLSNCELRPSKTSQPLIRLARELFEQPGLADAGLLVHCKDADGPVLDVAERALEVLQLAPPSDQGIRKAAIRVPAPA